VTSSDGSPAAGGAASTGGLPATGASPATASPATAASAAIGGVHDRGELRALADDCVHCGFCLPACPTYQLWGEEMDSPRGRIHLMTQVIDGAALDGPVLQHLDRCLGCMACMTACPSGVQYDRLIEAARSFQPDEPRTWKDRITRELVFAVFPYPRRLRLLAAPLRAALAARRAGLDRPLSRLSPALGSALRLAPPPPPRRRRLPERVPARGRRRAVVGMLTGCVQGEFFPQVNAATARVLAAEGCDVVIPRDQGCCGALSLHTGRSEEAERFARRLVTSFGRAGVDAVVVNAAGCGSAMKDYHELLPEGEPALDGKVRDLAEFLAELGPVAERHPLPVTAAYHDACHLNHAQGIREQPRSLLRDIPWLELVEVEDAGTCCGSAGVYNLLQPDAARDLGERKAASVAAAGADLLISANPGCSLQISAALAARGEQMAVAHTAEVLDASIRGVPVESLTGRAAASAPAGRP
jgi:glycolate oxidase iron-sulfur subunit